MLKSPMNKTQITIGTDVNMTLLETKGKVVGVIENCQKTGTGACKKTRFHANKCKGKQCKSRINETLFRVKTQDGKAQLLVGEKHIERA